MNHRLEELERGLEILKDRKLELILNGKTNSDLKMKILNKNISEQEKDIAKMKMEVIQ